MDAGKKSAPISVGCSNGVTKDIIVLIVSTDGIDPPKPDVVIDPTSSSKCCSKSARRGLLRERQDSCNDCLAGTWSLDLDTFKTALTNAFKQSASDASITNLKLSGSSTFTYDASPSIATMSFDELKIGYDGTADEYKFHTDIDVNGNAKGAVVLDGGDSFHWENVVGTGMFNSATTLKGIGDDTPVELDMPLTSSLTDNIEVKYDCNGDQLTLQGQQNGKYFWTYSYTRSRTA